MRGWYPRRRGILEHLERGSISLLDAAVHDFLSLTADFRTGVAWASAEKIRALCPSDISLKSIQRSLAKLESLGWIKRFRTHGKKGNYPVVIGKYFVRDSSLTWYSINLDRTHSFRDVQFDLVTDPSFVTETRRTSSVTDAGSELGTDPGTEVGSHVSPLKEVRSENSEVKSAPGRENRDMSPGNGDAPPNVGGAGAAHIAAARALPTENEVLKSMGPRELKGLKKSLERTLGDRRMPAAFREIMRQRLNEVVALMRSPA